MVESKRGISSSAVLDSSADIDQNTDETDYTLATAAVASSGAGTTYEQTSSDMSREIYGSDSRHGVTIVNNSCVLVGLKLGTMTFYIKRTGSITGAVYCRIRNSGGTIQETSLNSIDAGDIGTSYEATTFNFAGTHTLVNGDHIHIEWGGGSKLTIRYDSTGVNFDNGYAIHKYWDTHSYFIQSYGCPKFSFTTVGQNAIKDGSTSSKWTSDAGANENAYIDMGSSIITNQICFMKGSSNTETEILFEYSDDGETWTAWRTCPIALFDDDTYAYVVGNFVNARYFRAYGNSGNSLVLSIVEMKPLVKTLTQAFLEHGHTLISPTDTTLGQDGT